MPSELPSFVNARIEAFVEQRFKQSWGGRHLLHGRPPPPDALLLCSNDYLCLATEPSVLDAQTQAQQQQDRQLLMAPVFHDEHSAARRLEQKLARYCHTQDSILCQSGWAANTGLLQAIASVTTPVYLDHLAHMSLWYGARAAGAKTIPFRHNNPEHLRQQLKRNTPGVIVVDAIYSTNGNLCELADIATLSTEHGCVLVVDESHSLGVYGPGGIGLVNTLCLQSAVHFITLSLAKAFAGRAGLIACQSGFRDYFMMTSYPTGFSSALLNHELAGIQESLELLVAFDDRRERLREITERVRDGLNVAGIPLFPGTQQIVALAGGEEQRTMALRDALESQGIFGSVFCAPATPLRHALVRLSLHSGLDDHQVQRLVKGCVTAYKQLRA